MPAIPPPQPLLPADSRILDSREPAAEAEAEAEPQPQILDLPALTPSPDVSLDSRDAAAAAKPESQPDTLDLSSLALSPDDILASPSSTPDATAALLPRQQSSVVAIPLLYQGEYAGPAPGAVAGIVLGSIAGFLFLLWVLWALSNGTPSFIRATHDEEEVVTVRHRSRSPPRSRRARSQRAPEMESRAASPPPVIREVRRERERDRERTTRDRGDRGDRVYRSERIVRDLPAASRSPPRSRSRVRETVIVEGSRPPPVVVERRVDGDDVVEVIEEHDSSVEPPRRKSRRSSGYRSVVVPAEEPEEEERRRVASGYRAIDPRRFAGGDFKPHRVR